MTFHSHDRVGDDISWWFIAWMVLVVLAGACARALQLHRRLVPSVPKSPCQEDQRFMLDQPESISQLVDRTNRAELIADTIASDEAMASFGRAEAVR